MSEKDFAMSEKDFLTRLRDTEDVVQFAKPIQMEAADEIKRLRAENERQQAEIKRLMDGMEAAWVLIASAEPIMVGREIANMDWDDAMARWRDNHWHPVIATEAGRGP